MRISDWSSDVCSSDLNLDIVDVEQQAAAGASAKFVQKIDLAPIIAGIGAVARGVFDQDRPEQPILHAADLGRELIERGVAIGDRPQVGKFVVGRVAPTRTVEEHLRDLKKANHPE